MTWRGRRGRGWEGGAGESTPSDNLAIRSRFTKDIAGEIQGKSQLRKIYNSEVAIDQDSWKSRSTFRRATHCEFAMWLLWNTSFTSRKSSGITCWRYEAFTKDKHLVLGMTLTVCAKTMINLMKYVQLPQLIIPSLRPPNYSILYIADKLVICSLVWDEDLIVLRWYKDLQARAVWYIPCTLSVNGVVFTVFYPLQFIYYQEILSS